MNLHRAIGEALSDNRYRGLGGTWKGIIEAMIDANSDKRWVEDSEWLVKAVTMALKAEADGATEGFTLDASRELWAKRLADEYTESGLRKRLAQLTSSSSAPSVLESGHRSTRRAVASEAAASGFEERMVVERALEIKATA